jgi:hypothetical protein
MNEGELSLLNRAIYHWDWFLLKGEPDSLVAAAQFMESYRKSGGELYQETEKKIQWHAARLAEKETENATR